MNFFRRRLLMSNNQSPSEQSITDSILLENEKAILLEDNNYMKIE